MAYNITKRIKKLSFGQRGTPTDNRELSMGSNALQLIERSKVTSAFSSIREFGFFLDGTIKIAPQRYLKPSLVITNGDGINGLTQDRGGLKYGGRLDVNCPLVCLLILVSLDRQILLEKIVQSLFSVVITAIMME